jgi:ribonuclease R
MKLTGKILFHDTISIEHQPYPIKKTEIFSKILENDLVEYEIEDGFIIITKIIKRTGVITLGYIRSYNEHEKKVYFKLPLYNDTFSFFYHSDLLQYSEVGSLYLVNVNFLGLDILEYFGNIKHLSSIKKGIDRLFHQKNVSLLESYKKNLPIYEPNIVEYKDLTHLNTFNIDPEGTKDIDDAISIDIHQCKIYVHIVDIHNQVPIGSEQDLKCLNQAINLYLPDKTYHCIDKEFSFGFLSLKKGEKKKTVTFEYTYDSSNYEIIDSNMYYAIIENKHSYTYNEFDSLLTDENITPEYIFIKAFTDKWKLKTFYVPYIKYSIEKGYIKSVSKMYSNTTSHKFIECMMILSNCTYSKHIQHIFSDFPKRSHPKTMHLENKIYTGIEEIDNYIQLKKYKKAFYSIKDVGHFGLSLEYYTHFTSPIRRYIDVINHRLFAGCMYDIHMLDDIVKHIQHQEILLNRIYDWYYDIILHKYLKISYGKQFDAYIIRIHKNGIHFLIPDLMFEHYIHISKINKEKKSIWSYLQTNENEETCELKDQYENVLKFGDKISIKIDNITLFQISFSVSL